MTRECPNSNRRFTEKEVKTFTDKKNNMKIRCPYCNKKVGTRSNIVDRHTFY